MIFLESYKNFSIHMILFLSLGGPWTATPALIKVEERHVKKIQKHAIFWEKAQLVPIFI